MYDSILFPFDGSSGAAEALHHTAEIAHWTDATVRVLYVADTTRDSVTVVGSDVVDALVDEGESVVAEAAKTLETLGVPHETDVVQGNPAPTVAEYAERYGYDLVVMPTHGRQGVSRYLIGSVSEKVLRLSSVPVLSVRMVPEDRLVFPYETILIPTDGSPAAAHATAHLLDLAASVGATVHVLSVVEDPGLRPGVDGAVYEEKMETTAREAVEAVVSEASDRGVTQTVTRIEHGEPVEEILAYLEASEIDAVGMGATGRRGTDRILLGSVAEKTVRSAPVPVLTVRRSDDAP